MPFYEYMCMSCKDKFEELQGMSEEPLKICKKCSGKLKRLISKAGIQVVKDARELKEKIKEEVRKDVQDIKNGDIEKAADFLGEKRALEFYGKK